MSRDNPWRGRGSFGALALTMLLVLLGALQPVSAAPPPAADFAARPLIDGVVLSPSGQRLALLAFAANGRRHLAVMELDPVGTPKVVAGFGNGDILKVWWANDERLVFEAFMDGPEVKEDGAGTFAVDHDGSDYRELISWRSANESTGTRIVSRVLTYGWFVSAMLDDGSDDILVHRDVADSLGEHSEYRLARLDTRTGLLRTARTDMPRGASRWVLDAKRAPRVTSVVRDGRHKIFARPVDGEAWAQLADFDQFEGFWPWFFDSSGQLLVESSHLAGTEALYSYDLDKRALDPEPLIAVKGFDLNAETQFDSSTRRLVGLHFRTDRPMSYWFDDKLDAIQRSIDKALPGRFNRIHCGRCESSKFFVVHSTSDRHPGEYFLLNRATSKLSSIGPARPWIDEKTQGRRSFHRVATRDGLSMPVYVTSPPGAKDDDPLPAVVVVHGGPWVRGSDLRWEEEAQFLASRGYRVIEPEFRGSTGYGGPHFRAGWKQWGLAMQDDLADAVQWAAERRLADPSRVCIMGASYGGYAALMGPIRHPRTYRCAISFAGVTDIDLMFSIRWSDISEQAKTYSMPRLIGDPEKEAQHLRTVSPLKRVAEIKVPVLLAHGNADRRVPDKHAYAFAGAARSAGVAIEEAFYENEGHGWFDPANHADFLNRVEKFLARSLAPK